MTSKRRQAFSTKRVLVSSNYILTSIEVDESKETSQKKKKNKCLVSKLIIKRETKKESYLIYIFSGTLISAFAVFCCGKHDYEKNIVACFYNLLAAILQSATIFLLVGWIWSVRWGILFIQLSGMTYNKEICIVLFMCMSNRKLTNSIENKLDLSQSIAFFFPLFVFLCNNDDENI